MKAMMKKILLIGFLFVLFGSIVWTGCHSTEQPAPPKSLLEEAHKRGHLVIGVKYDSPPFGFLDTDSQLKGLEIDLAHELARRIIGDRQAVRFVQVNTSTRVATLNAYQADFILATMTITPEREKIVSFTKPYYKAAQGIMVKETSEIRSLKDLAGKKIIYVIGGTGEANLKKSVPSAKLLGFRSTTEAFSGFHAGRSDAFSTDDSILYGFLHEYCGLRLLDERISTEPYGIAFRRDAYSRSLQDKVQEVLSEMTTEGVLKQYNKKWNHSSPPADCSKAG